MVTNYSQNDQGKGTKYNFEITYNKCNGISEARKLKNILDSYLNC